MFGYDLDDYDELFVEKLELLLELRANERVTSSGKHRPPIDGPPAVRAATEPAAAAR